jgi:hypothetical protein
MKGTTLRFPACTGAVISDLETATSSREAQLRMIMDKQYYASSGWATISIGGNDLGFGDIAWYCLYWWDEDKCTSAMANAATKLRSDAFACNYPPYMTIYFWTRFLRGTTQTGSYSS